ncbi:hypothetical protein [Reticulibacter mediterranei]|nr:hypothetical protein [Reticulibacter mediterranei]
MTKTFDIPFSGDTASILQRAKNAAKESGATLTGDTNSGNFSGKGIEGHYEVSDNTVHVTITKKPIVVLDSVIESQLRKFFGG